ncbi:ABC transporter substrate-binding protein/permease [Vagococcus xieshaowenii]|uniref:Transporter substrate-binding domain-containing protein n=1 Tax=Vagococcus xieshaowenii TaxID=2562451 RepID=A0AAJ5EFD9_9ENTE|nr:ABC transporter substrate-binding protein/permease [Vagococcus xieshaowenii]QCA28435.1 transporter substrate-binding domain-containing protein [Vagococcus xieshaowenii]TFZ42809.1 transporter substrate-binding domain-containing protein [Vagococcus xieshaowenii]
MKLFKRFNYLLFILLFTLPTIGLADDVQDDVYQKIVDKGVLNVGLSADYPPYEFHATVDGKDSVVGMDVSIAEKIAEDLGVELKITEMGFDGLLGALQTNKIDLIISGMTPTPEREKEVNFSNAYNTSKNRIIVRKADKNKFKSLEDFDGLKVGAQKQSVQEELVNNELVGAKGVSLQKFTDIVLQLQNDKIDAAVVDGPVAEAYLTQIKDLAFSPVEFEEDEKESSIALSKDAPLLLDKVNASIEEMHANNLIDEYKEKAATYMVGEESFWNKYGSYYVKGTLYTLLLAFVGVLCGTVIGAFLSLMKLSKNKILKALAFVYIEYVRGTPLLVQIFLVFFGSNVIGLDLSAIASSLIALSLNSAAYVAEIFRAGIKAVDDGQTEAARSLGMNKVQSLRHIVLPQAIKNILPALGNEFVTVIKESSVVSVIGVSELMFQSGVVQGASFKPFLPIVIASLIYFFLTFTLSRLLGVAERKMNNA